MAAQEVSDYYERYWGKPVTPKYVLPPELKSLLRDNVTPTSECLDVGCGAGNSYAPWVAENAKSYVGVDVAEAAVQLARERGLDGRRIDDAAELPFADGSFDTAICIEVFEHLFQPEAAAKEIRRVLRPGGRLVASVPNAAYWRLRVNLLLGMWNPLGDELAIEQPWRDPHIRFFTVGTFERMLHEAGFRWVDTGAHDGCFIDHLTSKPTNAGVSRAYRWSERRLPSLLGLRIHALAGR